MIRIEHDQLDKIIETHLEACRNYIKPRLKFYEALFNACGNKVLLNTGGKSLSEYFDLHDQTIIKLINSFLKKEYRKAKEDPKQNKKKNSGKKPRLKAKINCTQIKTELTSNSKYLIDNKSFSLNFFKNLHSLVQQIESRLDELITAEPKDMMKLVEELDADNLTGKKGISRDVIIEIFSYEDFTKKAAGFDLDNKKKWNHYALTSALGLAVCPYCNRNYIITVIDDATDKELVNPTLDHFFCKMKYPLLRLSFYNLIPSCEMCNQRLKGTTEFDMSLHLHPYFDEYHGYAEFKYTAKDGKSAFGLANNFDIELEVYDDENEPGNRIAMTNEEFHINTIYSHHGDIVAEIIRKMIISNNRYLEILKSQFPEWNISKKEMYRLAFGNYPAKKDFKKRPLAKLTYDVVSKFIDLDDINK